MKFALAMQFVLPLFVLATPVPPFESEESFPFTKQDENKFINIFFKENITSTIDYELLGREVIDSDIRYKDKNLFTKPKPIKPKLTDSRRPSCAKSDSQTFCDISEVSDYPEVDIRNLVQYDSVMFSELFGLGASTGEEISTKEEEIIAGRRPTDDNYIDDESNICDKKSSIFYPQTARNRAKEWVYVVNDKEFIQAVTSEECLNEGTTCNHLADHANLNLKSHCRQKYSYKKLLAVHPDEMKTYTDLFPIPSCCSCYVSILPGFDYRTLKKTRNQTEAP